MWSLANFHAPLSADSPPNGDPQYEYVRASCGALRASTKTANNGSWAAKALRVFRGHASQTAATMGGRITYAVDLVIRASPQLSAARTAALRPGRCLNVVRKYVQQTIQNAAALIVLGPGGLHNALGNSHRRGGGEHFARWSRAERSRHQ